MKDDDVIDAEFSVVTITTTAAAPQPPPPPVAIVVPGVPFPPEAPRPRGA